MCQALIEHHQTNTAALKKFLKGTVTRKQPPSSEQPQEIPPPKQLKPTPSQPQLHRSKVSAKLLHNYVPIHKRVNQELEQRQTKLNQQRQQRDLHKLAQEQAELAEIQKCQVSQGS